MPRKKIPAEMEKLKQKISETPPGTERIKFIRIYQFCDRLISYTY
jgi:hypothetical protein